MATTFGRCILDEVFLMPKHLLNMLKRGPKTFCCQCTKGLFKEAIVNEIDIHLNLKDHDPEVDFQPRTYMHFCSTYCANQFSMNN